MPGGRVTKLRALIVDDEPLARDTIRRLLARDPDIEVAGECSGADAVPLIVQSWPDLLFLDVQMPEVDGFEVIAAVGAESLPGIVFVTAYDQYALRAFDVHAIDYLLKPFDDARFALALARAKERALAGMPDGRLAAFLRQRSTYLRRFLVRKRDRVLVVAASDVDWIEAADYYASLHVGEASHLLRETLTELEQRLDPEQFVRVHRSAIVNVARVREIHPLFRGDCALVLADGTRVKLSRARRDQFERLFSTGR
jgi:two-component system LytT family response regulator